MQIYGEEVFGLMSILFLRHTFATRLFEKRKKLKVVQELLGHARIQVTADTYSHVSPELKKGSSKQNK